MKLNIPIISQQGNNTANDCGPACVAMLAGVTIEKVMQAVAHTPGEMIEIAKVVRDYQPVVVPPPVTDWKSEIWQESIERQAISLNPTAALQHAIFKDLFVPVQSEFYYVALDGINRACMAAESLSTGERRVYYAVVPNWSNVQWFKM